MSCDKNKLTHVRHEIFNNKKKKKMNNVLQEAKQVVFVTKENIRKIALNIYEFVKNMAFLDSKPVDLSIVTHA